MSDEKHLNGMHGTELESHKTISPQEKEDEIEEQKQPRRAALLLSALWCTWLVACIADTLLELDLHLYSFKKMSPLLRYLYINNVDVRIARLDKYHIITLDVLRKIVTVSLTLSVMLILALSNVTRLSYAKSTLTFSCMAAVVLIAAALGASAHEANFIAVSFSYLLSSTMALALEMSGWKPGFVRNESLLCSSSSFWYWGQFVGLASFILAYGLSYRFESEFIILMILWEGFKMVYKRL